MIIVQEVGKETATRKLLVPLNRVEGDLEIRVELRDGHVVDAWSAGTMYRGFENVMAGRSALDGLVITPRICGMCSTAHLTAAAKALDAISGLARGRVPCPGDRRRGPGRQGRGPSRDEPLTTIIHSGGLEACP